LEFLLLDGEPGTGNGPARSTAFASNVPGPRLRSRALRRRRINIGGHGMWQRLRLLSMTLGLLAVGTFSAEPADDIKPPSGYRQWFHVNTMIVDKESPLFADLGGMHNVYVNSTGLAALKKGAPYPDKSTFVTDLHEFTVSDGSYVEGARKALAIMVKDAKKYASTGGWGFQLWDGGDLKKPLVTDAAKQCFACHQPKKDQDYVYSTYIP
jgi:Cytochrome P460